MQSHHFQQQQQQQQQLNGGGNGALFFQVLPHNGGGGYSHQGPQNLLQYAWDYKQEEESVRRVILNYLTEPCQILRDTNFCPKWNSKSCFHYHSEKQHRRKPVFKDGRLRYLSEMCPIVNAGGGCPQVRFIHPLFFLNTSIHLMMLHIINRVRPAPLRIPKRRYTTTPLTTKRNSA